MSSDPDTSPPKQPQPLSPQDLVIKEAERLKAAIERINAFEEARWGLFTPRELHLIQKAVERVALDAVTGSSIDAVIEANLLLGNLHEHLEQRYFPPEDGVLPD